MGVIGMQLISWTESDQASANRDEESVPKFRKDPKPNFNSTQIGSGSWVVVRGP